MTRRAVLGFHAARSMDRRGRLYAEPEASELCWKPILPRCESWIRRRGGLTSRLLLLRGRELAAIYPCMPLIASQPSSGQLTIQGMPN